MLYLGQQWPEYKYELDTQISYDIKITFKLYTIQLIKCDGTDYKCLHEAPLKPLKHHDSIGRPSLNGQAVNGLGCWSMVRGSSPSLGKTPTIKTVIQLQGLQ